jgi:hypothetical protein
MIQIDGPRGHVYIKFVNEQKLNKTLQDVNGIQTYRHDNGEQSKVIIEIAGMGMRDTDSHPPPEVSDRVIQESLSKYGDVLEIKAELWTNSYRYKIRR